MSGGGSHSEHPLWSCTGQGHARPLGCVYQIFISSQKLIPYMWRFLVRVRGLFFVYCTSSKKESASVRTGLGSPISNAKISHTFSQHKSTVLTFIYVFCNPGFFLIHMFQIVFATKCTQRKKPLKTYQPLRSLVCAQSSLRAGCASVLKKLCWNRLWSGSQRLFCPRQLNFIA